MEKLTDFVHQDLWWILLGFLIISLIQNYHLAKKLNKNGNIKKVTLSPGGVPMVWISDDEFFVDIENVDRSKSWRELADEAGLEKCINKNEENLLSDISTHFKNDKVRLYFYRFPHSSRLTETPRFTLKKYFRKTRIKPDFQALLTLYKQDKKFGHNTFLWFGDQCIKKLIITSEGKVCFNSTKRGEYEDFSCLQISGQKV